ncbi:MAG: gamma-glutamyl-gamma-aminobutyrate hydrolase family protein [Rubrimonas sp.]|uniref:gamma-glutamyl-gamma-aminobutyrate hydrolase family protein n=1 Tax=Rubrimonas sp. TaxID=2036015 RepID=UPI002FDCAF99
MISPLIGVTGPAGRGWALWTAAALSLWLQGARARRVTPPFTPGELDGLDGLLIGGGDDIGAEFSGAELRPDVRIDPARDALELAALERFWPEGKPVLGICRGAQMLNVFRGGTLHSDVRVAYDLRRQPRTPLPLKTVSVAQGSRLAAILNGDATIKVNSLHMQSVDRLGEGMRVAARDRHGMVQAVEAEGGPFRVGVQWHPELLPYRRPHRRLFRAFVEAARAVR